MIKPTIGRVVWFFEDMKAVTADQKEAGIVNFVHSDSMVNLVVFGANGQARGETSVHLLQDDEPAPGRCCCWMPYQKGQAVKTEELEKTIFETAAAARAAGPEVRY